MNIIRSYNLDFEAIDRNVVRLNARAGNVIGCYYNPNGDLYVNIEHSSNFTDTVEYEFLLVQNKEEVDLRMHKFIGTAIDFRVHSDMLMIKNLYHVYLKDPLIYPR